jgi:hypothetical protein
LTKPKLRTNKRPKICVIGKCCKCGERIWSNTKWVVLHGAYYCANEVFTQLVFKEEDWILKNPLSILPENKEKQTLYTSQN